VTVRYKKTKKIWVGSTIDLITILRSQASRGQEPRTQNVFSEMLSNAQRRTAKGACHHCKRGCSMTKRNQNSKETLPAQGT